MKSVLESKELWKTMRPFFSDKKIVFSEISIEKNNRIISDDFDLPEKSSTFFEDDVRLLNVEPDEFYLSDTENLSDPVEIPISKLKNHPSVQAIKQNIPVLQDFCFSNTEVRDMLKATVQP